MEKMNISLYKDGEMFSFWSVEVNDEPLLECLSEDEVRDLTIGELMQLIEEK